jgi:hypothetical protein
MVEADNISGILISAASGFAFGVAQVGNSSPSRPDERLAVSGRTALAADTGNSLLRAVLTHGTPYSNPFQIMSDPPDEDARPEAPPYPSILDRPVQEHLGKELRGIYNVLADKPTYLGESALPTAFDTQLDRLARRVTASEQGAAAVREALQIPDHPIDEAED